MELIKRAKEHLILYHPFFAYLALQVEFIREDDIGTSSIDGITFRYNKAFLEEHDHRWCANLIAHGMGKVLLLHPLRAEGKNIEVWNKASCYAVNSILYKAGIGLINDLHNPAFDELNAEQIYELLMKDKSDESEDSNEGESGFMGFNDGSNYTSEDGSDLCKCALPNMTETSEKEMESILTQKIMDAATQSTVCGTDGLPNAVKQIINELKEPKKDWRELLHKFTAEIARNDYDWMVPDETYLQRDIYIPSLHNEEIGGVIFAIDTSSSVDRELLTEFLSELKEAVSQMTEEVLAIHADMEVRKVEYVQREDIDKIIPEGRGGTSFIPVFQYVENNDLNPKALVYFTDGRCYETLIEPEYPVLWIIYNNKNFIPQFGEVIHIEKQRA